MKRILTLLVLFFTALTANAEDNILQAVQIDSVNDSYNIILKSDTEPELKKTVQASNKIVLTLKDIRASKTINTIYNNTTTVDSVVVEPVGDDSLNVIIQADNASQSSITFETLNSTLDILPSKVKEVKKAEKANTIVLSEPIRNYTPVYNEEPVEEEAVIDKEFTSGILTTIKDILSHDKVNNIVSIGLIGLIMLCGIKLFKREDSEIKVGLSQSLRDREVDFYKDMSMRRGVSGPMNIEKQQYSAPTASINPNAGYGLKAYQTGVKNPYVSSDIIKPRPVTTVGLSAQRVEEPVKVSLASRTNAASNISASRPVQNMNVTRPEIKPSNVDSIKFLESMTKIYEKNGRSDLARGLKASMLKAKTNV